MITNDTFTLSKVCIVDDDEIMLMQLESILKQAGFSHVTKVIGDTTLPTNMKSIMQHQHIFLDLNMPSMDGVEVLRVLAKANYSGSIILFSGEEKELLKSAEKLASENALNILGTIPKPATVELINEIMSHQHEQAQKSVYQPSNHHTQAELSAAILSSDFVPFFQPKIDIETKEVIGFEVLARWNKHENNLVSPVEFIPLLEEYRLIDAFTMKLFESSLTALKELRQFNDNISISFNISPLCLEDVNLPDKLSKAVEANGLKNNMIILEITESTVVDKLSVSLDVLTRLRIKGFGLSIDDFGTGYSSMKLLLQIPFTELKIDREFVHNSANEENGKAILEFCAMLAKKLKLKIVAEGVENISDWSSAAEAGCDLIQGYFVSKPMCLLNTIKWQQDFEPLALEH